MSERIAEKPQLLIEIMAKNMPQVRMREIVGRFQKKLPDADVRVEDFQVRYKNGPEFFTEAFIFLKAYKPYLLAGLAYSAKKLIDILAEEVRRWMRSRRGRTTCRLFIFGPDGEPLKQIKMKGKIETTSKGRWKDYARSEGEDLRRMSRVLR